MWWSREDYNRMELIPPEFQDHAGPNGLALVRLHKNGKTDPGWGENTFMKNYLANRFVWHRAVNSSQYMGRAPFAFIMRSMSLICIDIDGKNGGLEEAAMLQDLGLLPPTLAESSKSENGYHLFYKTSEDQWHAGGGFAEFRDRIGFRAGIDIRATGCVYHWPNQRWNHLIIAELPDGMKKLLAQNQQQIDTARWTIIKTLEEGDVDTIAMKRDQLVEDLGKPMPAGRRNNTLFAIGSQLMLMQVPDWADLVKARAMAVGLDNQEVAKLLHNIDKYGANA